VIVGRLIPAGTGLAYHEQRKKKRTAAESVIEEPVTALMTGEVVEALKQALSANKTKTVQRYKWIKLDL